MDFKSLLVGLLIGALLCGGVAVLADITPQGNLNFRGAGAVLNLKSLTIRSADSTLWTCVVTDLGAWECSE